MEKDKYHVKSIQVAVFVFTHNKKCYVRQKST